MTVLFTPAKKWTQPKCPSTAEMLHKIQDIDTNGLSFSHKKERGTDICGNMGKLLNEDRHKNHILCDFIHLNCPEKANRT